MGDIISATEPLGTGSIVAGNTYRLRRNIVKETVLNAVSPSNKRSSSFRLVAGPTLTQGELHGALTPVSQGDNARVVLSISHDDYMSTCGGVQNCIGDEQAALAARGIAYVSICPNTPLLAFSDNTDAETFELIVTLNGVRIGVARLGDLIAEITTLVGMGVAFQTVIHHTMGYAPESLTDLVRATAVETTFLWIHDSFSICPSIHLLRNEITFCGAPPPSSNACMICNSGAERLRHIARFTRLFEQLRVVVIAPSETMRRFWLAKTRYEHLEVLVRAPASVTFAAEILPLDRSAPLRVAFLGVPSLHKGWHVFESLARWHAHDPRYEFFHLGFADVNLPGTKFVPVNVSRANRNAMIEEIQRLDIALTIAWTLCYESFSFTTHESWAAGAAVVARQGAGHISTMLNGEQAARGVEIETEIELHAAFESGEIIDIAAKATRQRGAMHYGTGASDRLLKEMEIG